MSTSIQPSVTTPYLRARRGGVFDIPSHDPAIHGDHQSGIHPSIQLDPLHLAVHPLYNGQRTYRLFVYDHDAPDPASAAGNPFQSPYHIHQANWNESGVVEFHGDGSLTIGGHHVQSPKWSPAMSTISWAHQSGAVDGGQLTLSSNRTHLLGSLSTADGKFATVTATVLAHYHTQRRKKVSNGVVAGAWLPFGDLEFGSEPADGDGGVSQSVVRIDVEDVLNPGITDVSTLCQIDNLDFGTNFVLRKQDTAEGAMFKFVASFNVEMDTFTGTFTNAVGVEYEWKGDIFTPPPIAGGAGAVLPETSQAMHSTAPFTNSIFISSLPKPQQQALAASPVSDDPPALTLQGLIGLSSLEQAGTAVTDLAQISANDSYSKMLICSLPNDARATLVPNAEALTADEQAIRDAHSNYFDKAAVPYLGQWIAGASGVKQEVRDKVDLAKVSDLWNAFESVNKPTDGSVDPLADLGWIRDSPDVVALQSQSTSQHMDTYQLGYGNSLPIFQRYLQDPAKWYDLLADHLSSPQFLARWSMTATSPGYTTGHRQLYQWNTQLTLLEKAAAKAGKEIHYKTDVVTQGLTTAALMPNFQKVVWTDELRQTMKAQMAEILNWTAEDLSKKFAANAAAMAQAEATKAVLEVMGKEEEAAKAFDDMFRAIQRKFPAITTVNELASVQGAYADLLGKGIGPEDPSFVESLGDYGSIELGKDLLDDLPLAKWGKMYENAKSTLGPIFKTLAFMGCVAGTIAALTNADKLDPGSVAEMVGMCLEYTLKTMETVASTRLGAWISKSICSDEGYGKIISTWFKNGEAFAVEADSLLARFFTQNVAKFLVSRLGPLLSIIAVGVSIKSLVDAVKDGSYSDKVYAGLNLALAVIDTCVVFVGIAAAGATEGTALATAGACCGPIGIAVALIGVAVLIVSMFIHSKPPPPDDPAEDFVDGDLKRAGFTKS